MNAARDTFHSCFIIGSYLAVNPVRDSVLLFVSPAGCEKNVLHCMCANDWLGFDPSRVQLAALGDSEAVFGAGSRIRDQAAALLRRHPERHLFIVSSCVPEVTGEDFAGELRSLAGSKRMTVLQGSGFVGSLCCGFESAQEALVESFTADLAAPRRRSGVNLLGYLPERLEQDHLANFGVIRGILRELDVRPNVLFGEPGDAASLRRAAAASHNMVLAYGEKAARLLEQRFGQRSIRLDLPLGVEYTVCFIRRLGAALGRRKEARATIDRGLRRTIPPLQRMREVFNRKKVALAADSARLPGLADFVTTLGMIPVLTVVHNPGNPPARSLSDVLPELDLIIGSSVEKYRFGRQVPVFELSYPCFDRHCLVPAPFLGFEGALALANDLANFLGQSRDRQFGLADELFQLDFENQLCFRR